MLSQADLGKISNTVISTDQVILVVAATSVGKTRYIPPSIMKSAKERVMVAVPTREVARTMYNTVKDDDPTILVGYAAAGEVKYEREGNRPQVVYATSGHVKNDMLRSIREGKPLRGVLIVDEVHTGGLDTTIVISLWWYMRQNMRSTQKLLLMTATATGVVLPFQYTPHVIDIPRKFSITTEYLKSTPHFSKLYQEMASKAVQFHLSQSPGHILLFVPGAKAAYNLSQQISALLAKDKKHIMLTMHSGLVREEIRKAFSDPPRGMRKIIIATNLAETGITIPDTAIVINSMKENIVDTSKLRISPTSQADVKEQSRLRATAIRLLRETMITKNSAIQRGGRTGRTMNGIHAMMISEADYDELNESRQPEISRIPIHKEILELYMSGIPPSILYGIPRAALTAQIEDLIPLGMIVKEETPKVSLDITELGIFTGLMSLGIRSSTFLFEWIKQGNSCYWGAVLAAILEGHLTPVFFIPQPIRGDDSKREQHVRTNFEKYQLPDHLSTLLLTWISFEVFTRGNIKRKLSFSSVDKWCRSQSLNTTAFRETVDSIVRTMSMLYKLANEREFKNVLDVLKMDVPRVVKTESTSVTNLLSTGIPLLLSVYGDRVAINKKHGTYTDYYGSTCFINNVIPFKITSSYDIISLGEIESRRGKQDIILVSLSTFTKYDPSLYTREAAVISEYNLTKSVEELVIPGWFTMVEITKRITVAKDESEFFIMETVTAGELGLREVSIPRALTPRHLLGGKTMICKTHVKSRHILTIPNLLNYTPQSSTLSEVKTLYDFDFDLIASLSDIDLDPEQIAREEEYTMVTTEKDYVPFAFADFDENFSADLENECILYSRENF